MKLQTPTATNSNLNINKMGLIYSKEKSDSETKNQPSPVVPAVASP